MITGSIISSNSEDGIILGDSAQAAITGSTISKNGTDGIHLWGEASLELVGCRILRNQRYGVSVYLPVCVDDYRPWWIFTGRVIGKGNTILGTDEPDGNKKGAVCPPPALDFLMTEDGGSWGPF